MLIHLILGTPPPPCVRPTAAAGRGSWSAARRTAEPWPGRQPGPGTTTSRPGRRPSEGGRAQGPATAAGRRRGPSGRATTLFPCAPPLSMAGGSGGGGGGRPVCVSSAGRPVSCSGESPAIQGQGPRARPLRWAAPTPRGGGGSQPPAAAAAAAAQTAARRLQPPGRTAVTLVQQCRVTPSLDITWGCFTQLATGILAKVF